MNLNILTPAHKEAIRRYKYNGGDSSLIYQYILSPFAQMCVEHWTPTWLAPNVITLSGIICTSFAMVLTLTFNPNLDENAPKWLHLVTALSIFIYQTLDNMDGKQARRTGSSSPLGMLFDHSCDAINAAVISITMASAFATGWTTKIFLCLFSGYVAFYFQTWEEFYTGSMILPIFNGASEGLLISVTFCIISFVKGSSWWHKVVQSSQFLAFKINDISTPIQETPWELFSFQFNMSPFDGVVSFMGVLAVFTLTDQLVRGK